MCVEAQHRLAFEVLHGYSSFSLKAKRMKELRVECQKKGVWTSTFGAMVHDVLQVIAKRRGVETTCGVFLPISGYHMCRKVQQDLSRAEAAELLLVFGPMVATLWVGNPYFMCNAENNFVYRGSSNREKDPNHTVVCFAYRFVGEELHLRILDNHSDDGPIRWVLYEVIDEIYLPTLENPLPWEIVERNSKKRDANSILSKLANKIHAWLARREMSKYSKYVGITGLQNWHK
ncbi:hypothetical protein E2562_014069 [Oryza meyeriana var. granulata]|uniref:Uncharacterized protein n=1 Tax=Oryza meyeriana var. granulata TaxID=110450 RepID=A0A6G1DIX6_9ORYZ|nr:hypothetical protein E2562_014069 [Oryza meyeriana var. granulata]